MTVVISKKVHKRLLKEAGLQDRSVSNLVHRILKKHYKLKDDDE